MHLVRYILFRAQLKHCQVYNHLSTASVCLFGLSFSPSRPTTITLFEGVNQSPTPALQNARHKSDFKVLSVNLRSMLFNQ